MKSINFILCITYLLLSILNILGVIILNESTIFGITVGALFLCSASLFDKKVIRILFYIIAVIFVIIFPLIHSTKYIDSSSWLLLCISVAFLSNYLSKTKIRQRELKNKNDEIIRRKNEIEVLKNAIDNLKSQIDDVDKVN